MSRLGRLLVRVICAYAAGAFVASQSEAWSPKSASIASLQIPGHGLPQGTETPLQTPRISSTDNDEHQAMAMPMSTAWSAEWANKAMVWELRQPFLESGVVDRASKTEIQESESESWRQRTRAQRSGTRPDGSFQQEGDNITRIDGSTLGGEYAKPKATSGHTTCCAFAYHDSYSTGGIGCQRKACEVEEAYGGQRHRGRRVGGQFLGARTIYVIGGAAEDHPQTGFPTAEGRSPTAEYQKPVGSCGQAVEGLAQFDQREVRGATCLVQGEERDPGRTAQRSGEEDRGIERRGQDCGGEARNNDRACRTPSYRSIGPFRHYYARGCRRGCRGDGSRRKQEENGSWRAKRGGSQMPQDLHLNRPKVAFCDEVHCTFGNPETGDGIDFTMSHTELEKWIAKPWALHEGAYVNGLATAFSRFLQSTLHRQVPHGDDHRVCHEYDHGRVCGDGLFHGRVCDDQPGRDGRVHRHSRAHEHLPELALEKAAIDDEQRILLITYGHSTIALGRKECTFTGRGDDDEQIRDEARRLWREEFLPDTVVYQVSPEPHQEEAALVVTLLLDFLPSQRRPGFDVLVLLKAVQWLDEIDTTEFRTVRGPSWGIWTDWTLTCGLNNQCRSLFSHQCLIKVGHRIVTDAMPMDIEDGDLLTISYEQTGDACTVIPTPQQYSIAAQEDPRDYFQGFRQAMQVLGIPQRDPGFNGQTYFQDEEYILTSWNVLEAHPEERFVLQTYGLLQHSVGNRQCQIDGPATTLNLRRHLEQLWRNFVDVYHLRVYLVKPQPDGMDKHVLHLLVEFCEHPQGDDRGIPIVLEGLIWNIWPPDYHREAVYQPGHCTHQHLLAWFQWLDCMPGGTCEAEIWKGDETCAQGDILNLQPGDYVVAQRYETRFPDYQNPARLPQHLDHVLEELKQQRMRRPNRALHLCVHALTFTGRSIGSRTTSIDRLYLLNMEYLDATFAELWPGYENFLIYYFGYFDGEYNFVIAHQIPSAVTVMVQYTLYTSTGFVDETSWQPVQMDAQADFGSMMRSMAHPPYAQFASTLRWTVYSDGLEWTFQQPLVDGQILHLEAAMPPVNNLFGRDMEESSAFSLLQTRSHLKTVNLNDHVPEVGDGDYVHGQDLPQQCDQQTPGVIALDFRPVQSFIMWIEAYRPLPRWNLPDLVAPHEASLEWLALPWWNLEPFDEAALYTDGSYAKSTGHGGAGVALFVRQEHQWFYGGYLSSWIQTCSSAHHAELIGLLEAIVWLESLIRSCHAAKRTPTISLCFDAISAGYKATGHWGGLKHKTITTACQNLIHYYNYRYGVVVNSCHVAAHTGHPGNELANTVAEAARKQHITGIPSPIAHYALQGRDFPALDWVWALWKPEWVPYWNGLWLHLPAAPATRAQPDVFKKELLEDEDETKSNDGEQTGMVHHSIFSANVLSLLPNKKQQKHLGLASVTRTRQLQEQFHAAGATVVGIQETRIRTAPRIAQEAFWTFSSPATEGGHYGMQLWFSRHNPYATIKGRATFFRQDDFRIVHQDPRLLIVYAKAEENKTLYICAHALHSQATDAELTAWWSLLWKAIPQHLADVPMCVLIDANAHIGSVQSLGVSDEGAEEEDKTGGHFHGFIIEADLWAPATFPQIHRGEHGTWYYGLQERWIRNDYILLPQAWSYATCSSSIADVDVSLTKDDHRPVNVKFTMDVNKPQQQRHRKRRVCDRDGVKRLCYAQTDPLITTCDWTVDVHTHHQELTETIYDNFQQPVEGPCLHFRKHYLSDEVKDMIVVKRSTRRIMSETLKAAHLMRMRVAWSLWTSHTTEDVTEEQNKLRILDRQNAIAWRDFRRVGKKLIYLIRQEDDAYFTALTQRFGDCDRAGDVKGLWAAIRGVLPKQKARRAHAPLMNFHLDAQWMPHFEQLEAGQLRDPAHLVHQCVERQACTAPQAVGLGDLPTLLEVQDALRTTPTGKAPGPDGLVGDVLKYGCVSLTPAVHDFYVKQLVWGHEAVQAKGGVLTPIYKKGSTNQACSYRGILLLNSIGKRFHSWLRGRTMLHLQGKQPTGQIGGFPQQQVSYGSQAINRIARIAAQQSIPLAILFVDVSAAFHSLIRELVLGIGSATDLEVVYDHLTILEAQGVEHWLCLPAIIEQLGAPPALVHMLREVHVDTWLRMPHLASFSRTTKGSRPGSPMADIVWHILMLDLHKATTDILQTIPAVRQGFEALQLPSFAITWADDLAVPVPVGTNDCLVETLKCLTTKLVALFQSKGLALNFGKGKTVAVLAFRGVDAPKHRAQHLLQEDPGVTIELPHRKPIRLSFACAYRHLGVTFTAEGNMDYEIKQRIGQAATAYHALRKVLLRNQGTRPSTRLRLLETLVLTRLYFGLATWTPLSVKAYNALETFTKKLIRQTLSPKSVEGRSWNDLVEEYRIPSVGLRLVKARLNYVAKLYQNGPQILHDILHREEEVCNINYLGQIRQDLQWLNHVHPESQWHCMSWDMLQWNWRNETRTWEREIKKICNLALLQEAAIAQTDLWYHRMFTILKDMQIETTQPLLPGGHDGGSFPCWCGKTFDSYRGRSVHQYKVHQMHSKEYALVDSPICPACLKNYWTVARCRQHLAYIPRKGTHNKCYVALQLRNIDTQPDAQHHVPTALHGINRLEATQAEGPTLPPAHRLRQQLCHQEARVQELEEAVEKAQPNRQTKMAAWYLKLTQQLTEVTIAWCEQIEQGPPMTPVDDLADQWYALLQPLEDQVAQPEDVIWCFWTWGHANIQDIIAGYSAGRTEQRLEQDFVELCEVFPYLQLPDQLARQRYRLRGLQREIEEIDRIRPHRPVRRGPNGRRGARDQYLQPDSPYLSQNEHYGDQDKLQVVKFQDEAERIPIYRHIQGRPVFLLLHLFSGRRRDTDVHSHLAHMAAQGPFDIMVLSLDVAVNIEYGNLAVRSQSWEQVQKAVSMGLVAGTLAGSPCNTWSAARHYQPTEEEQQASPSKRWPRPLRSSLAPWGLPGLGLKEMENLLLGSAFSLQTLWVFLCMVRNGGFMMSEHPGIPKEDHKVSVWRTAIVRLLRQLPMVRLHEVPQGLFGAESWKATGLLCLRLEHVERSMKRWQCGPPAGGFKTAIGVAADGSYNTSKLKEYPDSFSRALAQSLYDGIARSHNNAQVSQPADLGGDEDLHQWIQDAFDATRIISMSAQMCHDLYS